MPCVAGHVLAGHQLLDEDQEGMPAGTLHMRTVEQPLQRKTGWLAVNGGCTIFTTSLLHFPTSSVQGEITVAVYGICRTVCGLLVACNGLQVAYEYIE